MKKTSRGKRRNDRTKDEAEFHRLFSALSPEGQLIVRNVMLVWRVGRIFRSIDPIVIGSHTNKKERKP